MNTTGTRQERKPNPIGRAAAAAACGLLICSAMLGCTSQGAQTAPSSGGSSRSAASAQAPSSSASASSMSSASSAQAPKASDVAIDWQTLENDQTSKDGYHLLQTMKVSPWIDASDDDVIEAAWSEVSKGNAFPSLSQFRASSLGEDQVAYAVGTLSVENLTEGFSISPTSNLASYFVIKPLQPGGYGVDAAMLVYYDDQTQLCHSNSAMFQAESGALMAKMTGDSWGPVPFVMVMKNQKTPNEPNGKDLTQFTFGFGN